MQATQPQTPSAHGPPRTGRRPAKARPSARTVKNSLSRRRASCMEVFLLMSACPRFTTPTQPWRSRRLRPHRMSLFGAGARGRGAAAAHGESGCTVQRHLVWGPLQPVPIPSGAQDLHAHPAPTRPASQPRTAAATTAQGRGPAHSCNHPRQQPLPRALPASPPPPTPGGPHLQSVPLSMMSILVSTPMVRSPMGSTSLASRSASDVARSAFAGVTARMMALSPLMYCLHISSRSCTMDAGWPSMATLVRPGPGRACGAGGCGARGAARREGAGQVARCSGRGRRACPVASHAGPAGVRDVLLLTAEAAAVPCPRRSRCPQPPGVAAPEALRRGPLTGHVDQREVGHHRGVDGEVNGHRADHLAALGQVALRLVLDLLPDLICRGRQADGAVMRARWLAWLPALRAPRGRRAGARARTRSGTARRAE